MGRSKRRLEEMLLADYLAYMARKSAISNSKKYYGKKQQQVKQSDGTIKVITHKK